MASTTSDETNIPKPTIPNSVFVGDGACVWGDVEIGEDSSVWYNAVIRGDQAPIRIGARSNVQDCAVIHVSDDYPVHIGDGVTIGHTAIVHGCSIGSNTLVGMGAVIMNGAQVGENCVIGAGSLVTQGAHIPSNSVAFGNPCKVRREASEADVAATEHNAQRYVELASMHKRAVEQSS